MWLVEYMKTLLPILLTLFFVGSMVVYFMRELKKPVSCYLQGATRTKIVNLAPAPDDESKRAREESLKEAWAEIDRLEYRILELERKVFGPGKDG